MRKNTKENIIARAIRCKKTNKVIKSVFAVYGIDKLESDLDKKKDHDPKRVAAWALYHYTNLSLRVIGERIGCNYCTVMYHIRTNNGLISTDYRVAEIIIDLEKDLRSKGLKKRNRTHKQTTSDDMLNYATSYKKRLQRPVSESKKAMSIIIATKNTDLIKHILKGKRELIEKETELEDVIALSKEIASLEYQLTC